MNLREMIRRGLAKKRKQATEEQRHPAASEPAAEPDQHAGLDNADGQASLYEPGTPPDTTSTRAHSTRHGKVTADKRNQ
jgi:hypothetical protein